MTTEFIELLSQFLKGQTTLALATSAGDGTPRIAPLFYYCGDDLRLYWFSSDSSEHSQNLARNNAAGITVYRSTDQWKGICGVQMRGRVSPVHDAEHRHIIEKAYIEHFHLGEAFQAEISKSNLYEFRPVWIRYIDNSKGFGYKVERAFN